jgi:hypothetical protein
MVLTQAMYMSSKAATPIASSIQQLYRMTQWIQKKGVFMNHLRLGMFHCFNRLCCMNVGEDRPSVATNMQGRQRKWLALVLLHVLALLRAITYH